MTKTLRTVIRSAGVEQFVTIAHCFCAVVTCLLFLSGTTCADETGAGNSDRMSTAAGTRFTLPESWSLNDSRQTVLRAPEGDFSIALLDIAESATARLAVESAWSEYSDSTMPGIRLSLPITPQNGWEEGLEVQFEVPPADHKAIRAWAFRHGKRWTVAILDGSLDTLDKQSAAIDVVLDGLQVPGALAENFAERLPNKLTSVRIQALEQFVQNSMQQLGIPGSAIALVENGKVIYQAGLGYRTVGEPDRVDARTRFMIASNTKPLTTLLLARMVDESLMAWDQPVVDVFPGFRLGTEEVSAKMQVRHLVCACTGLPRQDYGWIFATGKDTVPQDSFDQLATMQVTSGFGEVFQYSNLLASAGGFVAGHAAFPDKELGAAYDAAMQQWILAPIGMTETTFSMQEALAGNHATPHGLDLHGNPSRARLEFNHAIVPFRPAGGAWSTVRDMAMYVQTELSLGQAPDGQRVVSTQNMVARRARGVSSGNDMWYGMGIEETLVSGISVYRHGGSLPGYMSDFFVLPEAGIGAVILTNSSSGGLLIDPFLRRLIEILYEASERAVTEVAIAATRQESRARERRDSLIVPPPPEVTQSLASLYSHPTLGHIAVTINAHEVRMDFGLWSSAVGSRRNSDGTVSLLTIDPTVDRFEFLLGESEGMPTLLTSEAQHDYLFQSGISTRP